MSLGRNEASLSKRRELAEQLDLAELEAMEKALQFIYGNLHGSDTEVSLPPVSGLELDAIIANLGETIRQTLDSPFGLEMLRIILPDLLRFKKRYS